MSVKFKNKAPRKRIDRDGLVQIYTRQFGKVPDGITVPELKKRIKTFGKCECENRLCREPLAGFCEYDHKYRLADSREGDAIDWRALTKTCHAEKTHKRDTPNAAKTKRQARKYNPEYAEPEKPRRKAMIQSRGFDKTKTKGFDGKVRDRS